jgi:BirA family biotin operon repressor/biotin-[acetyl-CoA-carboxylase] ligase
LTLGAAAALAECFKLQVKWPNDLVSSEGKKVGGLLGELESRGAQILYVILGLGLNINQQHFPEDLPQASSLALVQGELLDKEAVIEQALFAILEGAEHVDRLNRWRGVSRTLGRQVRVGELEGLAVAIQEDGGLLLETKWGIRVIYSGLVEEQVGQSSSG